MSALNINRGRPSPAVLAEAAAWVARLHGPNRTHDAEAGLRRWLAEDTAHAAAFEMLTETWEKSARLRRRPIEQVSSWKRSGIRISVTHAVLATAMTFLLAVIGTVLFFRTDVVTTGIGELRIITLEDGTRVHLNTATRARVRYDKQSRRVALEGGEALFEVAKRPDWPFIVTAGERQIRALGTQFIVRRNGHDIEVILVEGKVMVSPAAVPDRGANQGSGTTKYQDENRRGFTRSSQAMEFTLVPGERLRFAGAGLPKIDRPALERVTAWERGEVALDDTSLADAVAEMNRYNRRQILIKDPALAAIRVSGIFQVGDSAYFAEAVARTHRMRVQQQPDAIILTTGSAPR